MKTALHTLSSGVQAMRSGTRTLLILLALLIRALPADSQERTAAPRIFFSDLLSGPAVGGQSDQGAFVTIYGSGFGTSRGTSYITIGDVAAASYPVWSDGKISFQLGRNAKSGQIVLHTGSGPVSNGIPFAVRPGRILFLTAKAREKLSTAVGKLKAGDILYVQDGFSDAGLDRYEATVNIMSSGRRDAPIALLAYPGAKVTIGSANTPRIAARTPNVARTSDHWVIGGIHFIGYQEALDVTSSTDWRVVGNDFTCPNGFGPTGCIEFSQASNVAFLGNIIHDVAQPGTTKVYHALYFSTDSNHIDIGWNNIFNVRGCRAIQFHSTPTDRGTGRNQYDLHVHDNIIHDVVCDGINFATIDPSRGTVEAYNNLFYNVGQGPDPPDGSSNYSCIYVQGGTNYGATGTGVVEIYNNTMYRCGGRRNTDSGAISFSRGSPGQIVHLRNNLIVLDSKVPLFSPNSTIVPLRAESNLVWWLNGVASSPTHAGFTIANPLLRDPAHGNFAPTSGSPALGKGTPLDLTWNLLGQPREKGRLDIGAY